MICSTSPVCALPRARADAPSPSLSRRFYAASLEVEVSPRSTGAQRPRFLIFPPLLFVTPALISALSGAQPDPSLSFSSSIILFFLRPVPKLKEDVVLEGGEVLWIAFPP